MPMMMIKQAQATDMDMNYNSLNCLIEKCFCLCNLVYIIMVVVVWVLGSLKFEVLKNIMDQSSIWIKISMCDNLFSFTTSHWAYMFTYTYHVFSYLYACIYHIGMHTPLHLSELVHVGVRACWKERFNTDSSLFRITSPKKVLQPWNFWHIKCSGKGASWRVLKLIISWLSPQASTIFPNL